MDKVETIDTLVTDEEVDQMIEELSKVASFEKLRHKYQITDKYLKFVMSQFKNGKRRTFEYSLKKMKKSLKLIEKYESSPTRERVKKFEWIYYGGKDSFGRAVIVTDFNRFPLKEFQNVTENMQ